MYVCAGELSNRAKDFALEKRIGLTIWESMYGKREVLRGSEPEFRMV